jgi:hypothetical protein
MKPGFRALLFLSFLFAGGLCYAQQPAFPSAVGAGAYATGGRGGRVIKVTTLEDGGPGSLRAALTASGPRIVVFDVSGTIVLEDILELGIDQSNVTIAGQTAPEGGITIAGRPVQLGGGYNIGPQACNNVVIRYIRFRNASYTGVADVYLHNGFISTGTDGLILDHCSFSFNDDQAISMNSDYGPLRNITIQRSIFSENATGIIIGANLNEVTGDATVWKNLFVDQSHRTPNMGGTLQFDVLNNVAFNWQPRLINVNRGSPRVNHIGNYLEVGDFTFNGSANKVQDITPQGIYTANNYHPELYPTPQVDDYKLWTNFYNQNPVPTSYFVSSPYDLLGKPPTILSAQEAYRDVLEDVGTNSYLNADGSTGTYQDSFDEEKIDHTEKQISSDPDNKDWTLPALPTNRRPDNYDTNDDGMPDAWKIARGFPADADLSSYIWPSGYVGVEEFLNEVDGPAETALPVDFISFTGKAENDRIELRWRTTNEADNQSFTVERSRWSGKWEAIGTLLAKVDPGAVNSYDFTDEDPERGTTYYRIRQEDYDGAFTFSTTISVQYVVPDREIMLFPNPSDEYLNIRSSVPLIGTTLTVLDASGRQLMQRVIRSNAPAIHVANLANGVYVIRFADASARLIWMGTFVKI